MKIQHASILVDSAYDTAARYAKTAFDTTVRWISIAATQAYATIQKIIDLASKHFAAGFDVAKSFLWKYKVWVAGGIVLAAALIIIYQYWNSIAQKPIAKLESSLDVASFTLSVPKGKSVPLNVTLTFCVDTSGSMDQEDRLQQVKESVNRVLDNAQDVIDKSNDAHIEIGIIGFNQEPTVVTPPVTMIPTETGLNESAIVKAVKEQLDKLSANGGTSISSGLEKAVQELEKTAKKNATGSHTIVLLTDGEDSLQKDQISSMHARLASINARFFAVGIGKHHHKDTLKAIAEGNNEGFKGTYIDTTTGSDSIDSAIAKIYDQTMASFKELELSTTQLEAGHWSVDGVHSAADDAKSVCLLGSLSEGEDIQKVIKIHSDELTDVLDLSTLKFTLRFKDPKGRTGSLHLPWDPNTKINPDIIGLV